nr:MAG TPA: hypothetical protein [Caudoviricetes sp.]
MRVRGMRRLIQLAGDGGNRTPACYECNLQNYNK